MLTQLCACSCIRCKADITSKIGSHLFALVADKAKFFSKLLSLQIPFGLLVCVRLHLVGLPNYFMSSQAACRDGLQLLKYCTSCVLFVPLLWLLVVEHASVSVPQCPMPVLLFSRCQRGELCTAEMTAHHSAFGCSVLQLQGGKHVCRRMQDLFASGQV